MPSTLVHKKHNRKCSKKKGPYGTYLSLNEECPKCKREGLMVGVGYLPPSEISDEDIEEKKLSPYILCLAEGCEHCDYEKVEKLDFSIN